MTCLCFSRMSNKARQWTSMWHVWRGLEDIISTVEIPQWCWQLNPARERWYILTLLFVQHLIVSKISMKCRTRNMSTKHCTRGKYAKYCIGLQYFITDSLQKTAYIAITRCSSNKVALRLQIIIWLASRLPGKAAILTRQLRQSLWVLLALLFLCQRRCTSAQLAWYRKFLY